MSDQRPFIPVRFAVLTVSDTRSLAEDRSGQTLADRIAEAGHVLAARDIVTDDREPIFEKRMDGFSEVFHRISYDKIGTSTIQSRATGGVVNATFVFVLPGSPGACRDAWDGILKAQFDYRHMPCNFVEIMPRLDEHLRRNKS
jgi:molybdenum cofactor biosynthesis protein B